MDHIPVSVPAVILSTSNSYITIIHRRRRRRLVSFNALNDAQLDGLVRSRRINAFYLTTVRRRYHITCSSALINARSFSTSSLQLMAISIACARRHVSSTPFRTL